jgi:uncharacterized protein YdaU (DUF1376 family)
MNYYPHHIGDFNSATRNLTWIQKWAYRELLELYYDQERAIANDMELIYFKLGARNAEQKEAISIVLKHFFKPVSNDSGVKCFVNARCDEEIAHYQKKQMSQSKAGLASAAARKATTVKQPLNKRQPTKNQNQEPVTRTIFKKPTIEECVEHIALKAQNPAAVADSFYNHFEASGWMVKGGVKMKSWKAALNGWVTRGIEYEANKRNISTSKSDRNDNALRELYAE